MFFVNPGATQKTSNEDLDDTLHLRNLPWSEKELKNISTIINGVAYLHSEATETAFKQNAGNFGILHLATHVILNDKEPLYSKFVFSKDPNSDEDGYLHLYELYNLRLNANMAVLSACETGVGKNIKGEGMMSLARGFAYAGCPSVIMSLWSIDDKSTSMIINKFYERLAQGKSKDIALRDAKLSLIQSSDPVLSNPYYWAGLVVVGNTDPLKIPPPENDNTMIIWGTVIAILTFLLIFINRLVKK